MLLLRFNVQNSKQASTANYCQNNEEMLDGGEYSSTFYRYAIDSLMYLKVCTRPDLAFAVCRLSRHMEYLTQNLWVGEKRFSRYVNGTAAVVLYLKDLHPSSTFKGLVMLPGQGVGPIASQPVAMRLLSLEQQFHGSLKGSQLLPHGLLRSSMLRLEQHLKSVPGLRE